MMGLPTSVQASIRSDRSMPPFLPARWSMFSTITIAPSTIIPMAMATPPRDMRLADTPKNLISTKAKRTENGMESATTRLGLAERMKARTTRITRPIPWARAVVMVLTQADTRDFWS